MRGKIRSWGAKQFGFIQSDEEPGHDIFFNWRNIPDSNWSPEFGQAVEFELVRRSDGSLIGESVRLYPDSDQAASETDALPTDLPVDPEKVATSHRGGIESQDASYALPRGESDQSTFSLISEGACEIGGHESVPGEPEAAAVTGITVGVTSMPVDNSFRADHPFVFAIREKDTQAILFIGKVMDPKQE